MSSEYPEFYQALENYYKLKSQYENEKNKYKTEILDDYKLSIKEKHKKYKQIKLKCVNCKRPVGTNFSSKYDPEIYNKVLKATCGDLANPCNLKIVLHTGIIDLYSETIKELEDQVQDAKNAIIEDKNRLIFHYINETEAIERFDSFKEDINDSSSLLTYMLEEYLTIVDNDEIKKELQEKGEESYATISLIQEAITKFNRTNDTQYVKDAVSIYVTRLQPLLKTIMKLKYHDCFVEYDDSTKMHYLMQKKNNIYDMEFYRKTPAIVENVMGGIVKPTVKQPKTRKVSINPTPIGNVTPKLSQKQTPKNKTMKQTKLPLIIESESASNSPLSIPNISNSIAQVASNLGIADFNWGTTSSSSTKETNKETNI